MKTWTLSALIAAALALFVIGSRRAQAAASDPSDPSSSSPWSFPLPDLSSQDTSSDSSTDSPDASAGDSSPSTDDPAPETASDDSNTQLPSTFESFMSTITQFTQPATAPTDQAAANERAFLATIRRSEGTDRAADPYRVTFGFGYTIQSLADHPCVTGEWPGRSFVDLKGARHLSTAAGAYQFLVGTWTELRDALTLPDFAPDSQDRAALELVRRRGALADVRAGRFASAVTKCAPTWASLPGAGYDQPEQQLATLQAAYTAAGGATEA